MTWTPWYHSKALTTLERELSHTTGLIIEIDDFEKPAPANFRLFGVTVREPETTEVIAQIREIQHVEKNGCVTLLLQQPEVQAAELKGIWHLILFVIC